MGARRVGICLLAVLAACDSSGEAPCDPAQDACDLADAGTPDGGGLDSALPDAGADDGGLPDAAVEPSCTEAPEEQFLLQTDEFDGCSEEAALPDRAFAWNAPQDGFYTLTAYGDCDALGVSLQVRHVACSEATRADDDATCAPLRSHPDRVGLVSTTLDLAEGESITAIVEGEPICGEHAIKPGSRQELYLHVTPVSCPWQELDSEVPLSTTVPIGYSAPFVRALSCSGAPDRRQAYIAWTAPHTGRFAITASDDGSDDTRLAMLDGTCQGAELACGSTGSVEVELEAGAPVILVVEADGYAEDSRAELHITAL